jgi:hypothetical protein
LSVGIWKVRFREKWNMGKTDDPQWATKQIGPVDAGHRKEPSSSHLQWATKNRTQSTQALVRKSKWIPNPRWRP